MPMFNPPRTAQLGNKDPGEVLTYHKMLQKLPVPTKAGQSKEGGIPPATPSEELDARIATNLTHLLLGSTKMDQLYKNMQQQQADPTGPMALLLAQSMLDIRDKMIQKGLLSSDRIWVGDGAVLDSLLEEAPWAKSGVNVNTDALKQQTLSVLSKFDEAGQQSKQKPLPSSQGALQAQSPSAPQPQPQAAPQGALGAPMPGAPGQGGY